MPDPVRNRAASVRARLLAVAKARNRPFDGILARYVLERLLYRLSLSRHRERFVLKGAMLLTAWFDAPFRPTRDLDLLGLDATDPAALFAAFRDIGGIAADDGVVFDVAGAKIERIREGTALGGLRLKTTAHLGEALVPVVVDIGFGDAVEPGIVELDLPVLLDLPAPRLRAYRRETVIAEKFHAMILFGRANSRMKDYYDIWALVRAHDFRGDALARAIAATFTRRKTAIPRGVPDGLSPAFAADPAKQRQWDAFLRTIEGQAPPLAAIVDELAAFLLPHAAAARAVAPPR